MDFSSLVLMERDKETNFLIKELGSYEVGEGATFVTKLYCIDGEVNMYFDTGKDVEEWEFSAIYDLFDLSIFENKGYIIEEVDDEFNPTWVLKFPYVDEYIDMKEKVNEACSVIEEAIGKVFEDIQGKESEYIEK